jgi:hypothetical protein
MIRDGRGNPGRIVLKNQPRITLANVLRRRRTTLKDFVTELGFTTFAALSNWCDRMGIAAPEQAEFDALFPTKVNSPMEGVVVLSAPPVIDEASGREIDPDAPIVEPGIDVVTGIGSALYDSSASDGSKEEVTDGPQKKRRSKKEGQPASG